MPWRETTPGAGANPRLSGNIYVSSTCAGSVRSSQQSGRHEWAWLGAASLSQGAESTVSSRAKKPPCSWPSPRGTFGNSPLSWDVWPCRYVYSELLGISAQEIKALAEEAVIGTTPPPGQR